MARRSRARLPRELPLFPIALIALGVLLLLQTTGVVPWSVWWDIWKLWPVLIIALGINLLLGGRVPWLAAALTAAALLVSVGLVAWSVAEEGSDFIGSLEQPLDGAERVSVRISFGAGDLTLGSLPAGSPSLITAGFRGREAEASVVRVGDSAELDVRTGGATLLSRLGPSTWDVLLSQSPDMSLDIDVGAADIDLDLQALRVADLSIDAGASDVEIVMPSAAGHVSADIDAGAASMVIVIPEGVGARIEADAAVGYLAVDTRRFPRSGDVYVSPGFDTLENRVALTIDAGAYDVAVQ